MAKRRPRTQTDGDDELRRKIATEAARLILRRKESDFAAARKRAARHWQHLRLGRQHIPANAEIQVQLQALSGQLSQECDRAQLTELRRQALDVLIALQPLDIRCVGLQGNGPVSVAAELRCEVLIANWARAITVLRTNFGLQSRSPVDPPAPVRGPDPTTHHIVCREWFSGTPAMELVGVTTFDPAAADQQQLRTQIMQSLPHPYDDHTPEDDGDSDESLPPEAWSLFRTLLTALEQVRLDPETHPEGDALYHSLQVFSLGRDANPYDEEFLLACLLHDVGLAIDPRHPVLSGVDALGSMISERTRFLIEQRPEATNYLATGSIPRNLRKSPDWDELFLLAQCDKKGRVAGQSVPTLDEALEYIQSLDTAWDDDEDH